MDTWFIWIFKKEHIISASVAFSYFLSIIINNTKSLSVLAADENVYKTPKDKIVAKMKKLTNGTKNVVQLN